MMGSMIVGMRTTEYMRSSSQGVIDRGKQILREFEV
jgi:hypothetical protein